MDNVRLLKCSYIFGIICLITGFIISERFDIALFILVASNQTKKLHHTKIKYFSDGSYTEYCSENWYSVDFSCNCTRKYFNDNGMVHRLDGPAIEHANGHKEWWVNGKRHRLDGSAIETVNGEGKYYIDGNYCLPKNFKSEKELFIRKQALKAFW